MRAPLIQRTIKHLAETLTSLYNKQSGLRAARKKFNTEADKHSTAALQHDDYGNFEAAEEAQQLANTYREQAALYTPDIARLKKRIAGLEQVQKALKHDLKCAQCQEVCGEDGGSSIWFNELYGAWAL